VAQSRFPPIPLSDGDGRDLRAPATGIQKPAGRRRERITITDLLEVGLLNDHATLIGIHEGRRHRVIVGRDSFLHFDDGRVARSLNAAARVATQGSRSDGWNFWCLKPARRLIPLAEVRDRLTCFLDTRGHW
jgi:hypothetical protein